MQPPDMTVQAVDQCLIKTSCHVIISPICGGLREETNSVSVLFIPLLRPWGKEAGIHPGYVTSPSQDTHQSKPTPCFLEPRTQSVLSESSLNTDWWNIL